MEWINVKDRLPKPAIDVLVVDMADGEMHVDYRCYDDKDSLGTWGELYIVTHWMPLPELPKDSS